MSALGLFFSVLLMTMEKIGGSCSEGFNVVSFTTFTTNTSSEAVCAEITIEVMTVNTLTLNNCADRCAFDQSCAGFNYKSGDPTVCDLFGRLPLSFVYDSQCTYYEVFIVIFKNTLCLFSFTLKHTLLSSNCLLYTSDAADE